MCPESMLYMSVSKETYVFVKRDLPQNDAQGMIPYVSRVSSNLSQALLLPTPN
jgi:hypothetical protein